MNTIPLTILAYEGPQLRAYLAMLRRSGFRAVRMIVMVLKEHPSTGKSMGTWLPRFMRIPYAERIQEQALNYWPRRIAKECPGLVPSIAHELDEIVDDTTSIIDEMTSPIRYEEYADEVQRVLVHGYRDPDLIPVLEAIPGGAVLYTGGGILPKTVVGMEHLRFLHVHPGHLPDVRGADGLLWSVVMRGHPSMSCFYMAPGIDTGDLITVHDYPEISFTYDEFEDVDDRTLYRAMFAFCDPILRADTLTKHVLDPEIDPAEMPTIQQDESEGTTYHFMHPDVRKHALRTLFTPTLKQELCEVAAV